MTNKLISSFLFIAMASLTFSLAQAASFDCSKAKARAEKLVCDIPAISKLDDELGSAYKGVLSKANGEKKQHLVAEQKHWLTHTRNACANETCLKQAYWSRLAEIKTFFEPKSPLYKHEADKAEAIRQVLMTAPLYASTQSDPQFCRQVFSDLKQMKDIRFVDPVVQTQSYEDPALDPWKRRCRSGEPLNFDYECPRNIQPDDKNGALEQCNAGYGLPPFKLFELPSLSQSGKKRYIFYSDSAYGPMNDEVRKPIVGGGFSGFHQIDFAHCDEVAGPAFAQVRANEPDGPNYNSIIEYQGRFYFLVLDNHLDSYWLEVNPISRSESCSWGPVKSNITKAKNK